MSGAGSGCSGHCGGEKSIKVVCCACRAGDGIAWECWSCRGYVETGHQALGVGVRGWCRRRRGFLGGKAEDVLFDHFDCLFNVGYACCFRAVVDGGNEVVNCDLVIVEEGVDVCMIEYSSALCLWEDEVEEEAEADPGVEGNPGENR